MTTLPNECDGAPVPDPLPPGFVDLAALDPTIQLSIRYHSPENFSGGPVPGYYRPRAVVTEICAAKLMTVQKQLQEEGLCLVVYDAYRPQKAVEHFYQWAQDPKELSMAAKYYPTFAHEKHVIFERGYLNNKSNHNRGSTVDVSIIEIGKTVVAGKLLPLRFRKLTEGKAEDATEEYLAALEAAKTKQQGDGEEISGQRPLPFLDDGTVDMGTSFDFLDLASHPDAPLELIPEPFHSRRQKLRRLMEAQGFVVSPREWWHYWLKDGEPFAPGAQEPFDFNL